MFGEIVGASPIPVYMSRKPVRAKPPAVVASRYLRALGITALCTALAYPVYPQFDPVNIVMMYLLGTTVVGLRLGRGPSALSAVANVAAFDFFAQGLHQLRHPFEMRVDGERLAEGIERALVVAEILHDHA